MFRKFILLCLLLILSPCRVSFAQDAKSVEDVYAAANQLEESKKTDEAKALYQQILEQYPFSQFAADAKLHFSRFNVLSQIIAGNDANAQAEIKSIEADFQKHPDFPWYLYGIANQYEELKKDNEANSIYQRILQQYPDSPVADSAKLHFSRYNVLNLIAESNLPAAGAEVNEITVAFPNHPDFPWYLYGVANQYEELKRYKEAKNLYQKILQECPNSPVAGGARLHFSRFNVLSKIVDGNIADAQVEIAGIEADFRGHPDFPWYLYGIANQYEEMEKDNEANSIYQRILQQYPDSPVVGGAKLHFSRYNVVARLIDGNDADAWAEIDSMQANFKGHPDLPWYFIVIAEECYKMGLNSNVEQMAGNKLMRFAVQMLEKYALGKISGKDSETLAYYMAAITSYRLEEPEKTVEYSDKLLQIAPDFRFAANMQWLIADGYEKMKTLRHLPADEINATIEDEYQILMDSYPQDTLSEFAAVKLGQINLKKGEQTKACAYFGWFLMNNSSGAEQFADIKRIVDRCGRNNNE